jgi:hypothetical protein
MLARLSLKTKKFFRFTEQKAARNRYDNNGVQESQVPLPS